MNRDSIHILMVEDNEDDYILTRELLRDLPHFAFEMEWINGFEDALTLMGQNRHDVYLVDYSLGKQTGLDILREATAKGCRGPVIFFTGQSDHDVDVEAMEAGAVDYLVKNQIDGPILERSIRYAIKQKRVEAELAEMKLRLADSREQERLHIAQELHDGPLQDLMGVHFHLSALANLVEGAALKQLNEIEKNLQSASHTLRSLCVELRPPVLAPFGLTKAIRAYAKTFQQEQPGLVLHLDLDEDGQLLPTRHRLALYRICQHALVNVATHAEADHVYVKFRLDNNEIMLQVHDDGKGFRVPIRWIEFARMNHLGLVGSAERAEAISGRLTVTSTPDTGTVLTVTAPQPEPE